MNTSFFNGFRSLTFKEIAIAWSGGLVFYGLFLSPPATKTIAVQQSDILAPLQKASVQPIDFSPPSANQPSPRALAPATQPQVAGSLFAGGSDSLVARTVGHAEGTRTADGSKTRAYYGHSDPGNGVWNLGSFSYQHGASSPEQADEKQLRRLQGQAARIRQRVAALGFQMTLLEELNGIDLANQSPAAALEAMGYPERLKQARQRGLTGANAVLWARTQSYWDPRRNRWAAPGLGNTESNITHDQNRRLTAIVRAFGIYQQQLQQRQPAGPGAHPVSFHLSDYLAQSGQVAVTIGDQQNPYNFFQQRDDYCDFNQGVWDAMVLAQPQGDSLAYKQGFKAGRTGAASQPAGNDLGNLIQLNAGKYFL